MRPRTTVVLAAGVAVLAGGVVLRHAITPAAAPEAAHVSRPSATSASARVAAISGTAPRAVPEPAADPVAVPAPAADSEAFARDAPALAPRAENDRIASVLRGSGPAPADALERIGRDVVDRTVAQVRAAAGSVGVQLDRVDCHAAGCLATLTIDAASDLEPIELALKGRIQGAAVEAWPGARIYPPLVTDGSRVVASVVLLRPTLPAGTQF